MKIIFSLLAIMILNKDCDQNKSVEAATTSVNSEKMSDVNQEYSQVWYEATTRGFYQKIWVDKDSITVTSDRNHDSKMRYPTPETDWIELITLLKDVDTEVMPNLEAPTSLRHHDGAAFASLAVSDGKNEIVSNSFDNGYPPKEIESVVNKVLSMKKMFEKN